MPCCRQRSWRGYSETLPPSLPGCNPAGMAAGRRCLEGKKLGEGEVWADGVLLYSWCCGAFGEVTDASFAGTAWRLGVSLRKAGEPGAALGRSWGIGWEGCGNWKGLGAVKGTLSMKLFFFSL